MSDPDWGLTIRHIPPNQPLTADEPGPAPMDLRTGQRLLLVHEATGDMVTVTVVNSRTSDRDPQRLVLVLDVEP